MFCILLFIRIVFQGQPIGWYIWSQSLQQKTERSKRNWWTSKFVQCRMEFYVLFNSRQFFFL